MLIDFAHTAVGFLVGLIVGMTGVGGGSLMTPILVLGFSVSPIVAVGTDLLYAALTKSTGIFIHSLKKTIDWRVVKLLCIGSIPAVCLSVLVLKKMIASQTDYERAISISLGIALVLTSLTLLFKDRIHALGEHQQLAGIKAFHAQYRNSLTVFSGALIGVLVALSSVGAGALGATLLIFLYPRMRTASIVGTDLAHAVPVTAVAGLGHAHLGTVDYVLLFGLLLGSIPGIYLGSSLSVYLPDEIMRRVLAVLLFVIGIHFAI